MITITGHSDDLVEVDGDIREEFTARDDGHVTLSDGTVLAYAYTYTGVWRFEVERAGSATVEIQRCSGNEDAKVYTDKVTVSSPIEWVRQGIHDVPGSGEIPAESPVPSSPVIELRGDEIDPLKTAVFVCLGAASACWEDLNEAGTFQSTRATEIGDELVAFIEKRYVSREWQDKVVARIPDTYEQRSSAEAMITAWLDDQEAELAKLREFARQVAPVILEEFKQEVHPEEGLLPIATATLDMDVLEKLTELAEDLDLGWEARA